MKQVLLNMKNGEVMIETVTPPILGGEGVLVDNYYSVISGGTEQTLLQLASSSYIGKIRSKPELFKKVLEKAKKEGPIAAYQQAMGRLNKPEPLGYSCAGVVSAVSPNVPFQIGDRVACGGAGYANHADVVYIPKHLCAKIPDDVSFRDAAFTTIGAIALQGVRIANVSVGERIAIIGLGLIGQLTLQILKAAGCQVFGVDIDEKKISLGKRNGLDDGTIRSADNIESMISSFTKGNGFDAVIITAATTSTDPLAFAGTIARQKGRIVLVGVVGMEIPRDIYYKKELELVVSCSYGPGRYDREYEEFGHDYPISYVRWTEQRNMEAFLYLLEEKKISLDNIVSHVFPINNAVQAYQLIQNEKKESYLGIVLEYEKEKPKIEKAYVELRPHIIPKTEIVRVGVIGAGMFATSVLLPALVKVKDVELIGIAAAEGGDAYAAAKNFGFSYSCTDYQKILEDKDIDAVIIATRNSLHSKLTVEAITKGKHVFVEKPLGISKDQLDSVVQAHLMHPKCYIQVGFNRRYAPMTEQIKKFFYNRREPMIMLYRVNGEHIPRDHWIYDEKEGGSRVITELCHFVDFCRYVVGSKIVGSNYYTITSDSMTKNEMNENISQTLKFKDGSVATILYNTVSDSSFSKEYVEIYSENSFVQLHDFRRLLMSRNGKRKKVRYWWKSEKGHKEELMNFINQIKKGEYGSIDDAVEVTKITFLNEENKRF